MARVKPLELFSTTRATSTGDTNGYDRKKKLAEMLMNTEAAPVWSTGQGLLQAGATMMGGFLDAKADRDEEARQTKEFETLRQALAPSSSGLGDAPSPFAASSTETSDPSPQSSAGFTGGGSRSGGSGGASRAAAANERAQRAHKRLVEKGYPEHVAAGIVANAMGESSLNTAAIGDNGTAFGLFQHRGGRFKNLQAYAKSQGKDWRDFDTNLDFADHEMRNGLDQGAALAFRKLQNARTAEEASDIFMHYFERPSRKAAAESGPKRRQFAAQLVRSGVSPQQAQAIAANPNAAMQTEGQEMYASGRPKIDDMYGQSGDQDVSLPPLDLSAQREKMRRGQVLMGNKSTFQVGYQLVQQAETEARQLQQEYEKRSFDLKRDMHKERRTDAREQDRRDFDLMRDEQKIIADAEREAAKWDREQEGKKNEPYTLSPGSARFQGDKKIAEQPKTEGQGMVVYDRDGNPIMTMGGAAGAGKPPTEMNQKYEQFYRRGSGANQILDQTDENLAKAETYIKEYGPQAASDYLLSDDYKIARQAADDFLITIIRPDTGAAVTDTEFRIYGNIFLPRPNDPPSLIAQKRESRARALEALKAGMKPEQVLKLAAPNHFDGSSILPKSMKKNKPLADIKEGDEVDGYIYLGGDKTKQESWRKK